MCSIISHNKQQPIYFDGESSVVGKSIPKNTTIEAFEALGSTLNYIDCCLKLFHRNYEERHVMHHEAMKNVFKQIQTIK